MAALGAGIDGDMLADGRLRADCQRARLAVILHVLGRLADRGEGIDPAIRPQHRTARDHGVRVDDDAVAELHIGSDQAKGTDLYSRPKFCAWIDHGGRMDVGHARPS